MGSLAESSLAAAEAEEWALTIARQADLAKGIEAAEAINTQYEAIKLSVEKEVAAVDEEIEQAQAARTEAQAAYEAACEEHNLYTQTVNRIEGYIKQGAGETSMNPNYGYIDIVSDVKHHIEELTVILNGIADQLERDKNLMKVYEETGFTAASTMAVAEYEAEIENLKALMAAEQINFEKLVAKKDQLLELLKNE